MEWNSTRHETWGDRVDIVVIILYYNIFVFLLFLIIIIIIIIIHSEMLEHCVGCLIAEIEKGCISRV